MGCCCARPWRTSDTRCEHGAADEARSSTERMRRTAPPSSDNGDVPGEITTLLLGAQGGEENSFVRLYQTTNAVVLRYLRVISDADPAPLALATWSTLLQRMPSCVVDDDDDWLELAVATARENALEATGAEPAPPALAIA